MKILFCNESSHLSTGYAVIGRELLSRLSASGRYELFEYASWGSHDYEPAWRYRAVPPADEHERQTYGSSPQNAFGAWKYEDVLLEFRPDVVWSIRDAWMDAHVGESPLKRHYRWAYQTTVDSTPQDEEWLALFELADDLFTYTDWGADVLRRQGGAVLPVRGAISPGVDTDTFKPFNRERVRASLGLQEDIFVTGFVARNQQRKLFPSLCRDFRAYLQAAPPDIARKSYLYLHTAWPDNGWNLPRLLLENHLGGRVLFTYRCRSCGAFYPDFWRDALTTCRQCGNLSASMPNSMDGIRSDQMAGVYNLFDVLCQYVVAEGFGMPMVEAASCGVPLMGTDHASVGELMRNLHGRPVAVRDHYRERETHRWMALPDSDDFVRILLDHARMPASFRRSIGMKARQAVLARYTWDHFARQWMSYFDSVPPSAWDEPPRYVQSNTNVPQGLDNHRFLAWGFVHVAGRPDLVGSRSYLRMLRDLNWGVTVHGGGLSFHDMTVAGGFRHEPFTRDHCMRHWLDMANRHNQVEKRRHDQR